MVIFLSAVENGETELITPRPMLYNLMSFYYTRNATNYAKAIQTRDNSKLIMIDSGAHSLQKGVRVNWDKYTAEYAEFIKKFDRDNVVGYFEMDVDNIIGYEKVLELRKVLESVSDKIIPVWHKNRGLSEFKKMCKDYAGKVVAITGFKNEDIRDDQYMMFVKYAKSFGCKVHCLGMTRQKVLLKVPFDYVDSSSWKQEAIRGKLGGRRFKRDRAERQKAMLAAYQRGMAKQKFYEDYWRKQQ